MKSKLNQHCEIEELNNHSERVVKEFNGIKVLWSVMILWSAQSALVL